MINEILAGIHTYITVYIYLKYICIILFKCIKALIDCLTCYSHSLRMITQDREAVNFIIKSSVNCLLALLCSLIANQCTR